MPFNNHSVIVPNHNWHNRYFHVPQLFQFSSKVEVLILLFTFLQIYYYYYCCCCCCCLESINVIKRVNSNIYLEEVTNTKKVLDSNNFKSLIEPLIYMSECVNTCVCRYHHHHHHHVALLALISVTLSCRPSLSSITPSRSTRLHPVSAQSCCI